MSVKESQHYYLYKAAMYQNYAEYYKYRNPGLHIHYYLNHLKNLNKAFSNVQENPLDRNTSINHPAKIRILHAAPNISKVTIFIDGIRSNSNYSYKSWNHYQEIIPGLHQIHIYLSDNPHLCLIDKNIKIEGDKFYTFIITQQKNKPKLIAVEDEPNVPAGETKIRFIHLSSLTDELDIAVKNRDVIFTKIQRMHATNYLGLTPMNLELEARKTGSKTNVLNIPPLNLKSNIAYTAIIINEDILVLYDSFLLS